MDSHHQPPESESGALLFELQGYTKWFRGLVQIGGTEFDGSEENLGCLYEHIRLVLPDDRLDTLCVIDLHSASLLKPMVRPASSGRHSEAARTPLKIKRPSKVMEDLVGLAGEIHAYRLLKIRYNAGPESWISGNGKIVFRDNVPADGRGCDFEIAHRDRTYFIEVKASEGEDECFTLGPSEVRLAMEVARKKRPNRSEFIILHVTRALSDQPAFKLLPNPYDPLYQSRFLMDGADVRVRYRTLPALLPREDVTVLDVEDHVRTKLACDVFVNQRVLLRWRGSRGNRTENPRMIAGHLRRTRLIESPSR